MCGIVGIFEYGVAEGRVDEGVLIAMRDILKHRGPDGEGIYLSPDRRVGLGHRRLSIVDVAGGAQPMYGSHGEVLVLNGEIYNYPALRRFLESEGVRFRTNCDTEVVLHLYERDPVRFLDDMVGMFAFALFDPRRGQMILARDRIGEKPLYWTDTGGRLVFASEAKALFAHPSVTAAVDVSSVGSYLANLAVPSPDTLFAGVQKLPPRTVAICDAGGMRFRTYWDLFSPRTSSDVTFPEAVTEVRRLLAKSIQERLMSDVPVGVLLSGGVDSTTLVALMKEQARGVASFSVGFESEPTLDERAEARLTAKYFGTDHHEVTVSESEAIDIIPKLIHHQDEPLADPVCIPLDFVCRLAADNGVKVVLAGEGADELFWGYQRYKMTMARWPLIRMALAAPVFIRARLPALANLGFRCLRDLIEARAPGRLAPTVKDLLGALAMGRLLPMHAPIGLPSEIRSAVMALGLTPSGLGWHASGGGSAVGERPLDTLAFDTQEYEFGLRLPELLLMRIDRFSMANSIEARVPFLDPALVEFAYRLPTTYKLHRGETKRVLRAAIKDIVPQEVLARPKRGFSAPMHTWFDGVMGDLLLSLSGDEALKAYFNIDYLRSVVEIHRRTGRQEFILWPVLNFALWHKQRIEGEALEPLLEPILYSGRR